MSGFKFHSLKPATESTVYLGVELEAAYPKQLFANSVASTTSSHGRHVKTNQTPDQFMTKIGKSITDGTEGFLGEGRDGGGIEIRTEPATFAWLMKNKAIFDKMFSTFIKERFTSKNNCSGMHVHVSKTAFTAEGFVRMIDFFKKNTLFIYAMSDREDRCEAYANVLYDADYKRSNADILAKVKECLPVTDRTIGSNVIVMNRKGYKTVEFRLFNGTLDKNKFFANIQFVYSIQKFTASTTDKENTLENYLAYIKQHRVTYKELLSNIKQIEEIITEDYGITI